MTNRAFVKLGHISSVAPENVFKTKDSKDRRIEEWLKNNELDIYMAKRRGMREVGEENFENIKAVMDKHVDSLMSIDGVVGVAIGALDNGNLCIKVMVTEVGLQKEIPDQLDNYPVVLEQTWEIRTFTRNI